MSNLRQGTSPSSDGELGLCTAVITLAATIVLAEPRCLLPARRRVDSMLLTSTDVRRFSCSALTARWLCLPAAVPALDAVRAPPLSSAWCAFCRRVRRFSSLHGVRRRQRPFAALGSAHAARAFTGALPCAVPAIRDYLLQRPPPVLVARRAVVLMAGSLVACPD